MVTARCKSPPDSDRGVAASKYACNADHQGVSGS
jgi:hypothetical protein